MRNRVAFSASAGEFGWLTVTPHIDGKPLPHLVKAFEHGRGWPDVGSYTGLIPRHFKYGALDRYFLGLPEAPDYWEELGGFYLLCCKDCGEVGCWSIVGSISLIQENVIWSGFQNPHRRAWDYSRFGPFTFDRRQYDAALQDLMASLPPPS